MTRSEQILKLIVEDFIRDAQPVGSQTLLEKHHLECSSATIRAEMNALEKAGYLEKPHTSAGRVPSSKGYEYYAAHLREERLDERVKYAIQSVLQQKAQSVEEVIKKSCEILSSMTNLASVVLGPKVEEENLISVQLIPISSQTVTAVFVTDKGYVENKTFVIAEEIDASEVQKTVSFLNERLKGTPISQIVSKMEAMKPAVSDYMVGQDVIYQALLQAFLQFAGERINLYGKDKLLDHPEFAEDAKKLRKIMSLLDHPEALREAMSELAPSEDDVVHLQIGAPKEGLDDVAILSANIAMPGGQSTSISLLGPSRMDYDKAMAMLEYVSTTLDEYFSGNKEEKGGKQCPNPKKPNSASKPKNKK